MGVLNPLRPNAIYLDNPSILTSFGTFALLCNSSYAFSALSVTLGLAFVLVLGSSPFPSDTEAGSKIRSSLKWYFLIWEVFGAYTKPHKWKLISGLTFD